MDVHSDDDFDHVRDFDMSDPDSDDSADEQDDDTDTPSTTPPRVRTPRPSNRKIIPCPYDGCSKTFNRNARLQEHIRSHTGERPFKCPHAFCPKAFLRDSHLKHHLTSAHSDVRKYKCSWQDCDKSFATGTRLRRHEASHEGKEKYRCRGYTGCNETFRKHETLRKHVLTVHEGQKPFPCDHINPETEEPCNKAFDTAEKLNNHKRALHDASRFSCTICATQAAAGSTDILMTLTDLGKGGHPPFSFSTYSELQAHIAELHPPTCPQCQATFSTNKELTRHLEIDHAVLDQSTKNTSKPQFPCPHSHCTQAFTRKGNLAIHIKTVHDKAKDFICGETEIPIPAELIDRPNITVDGCGRPFTSKASLIEHVRTAHFSLPSKRAQREEKKRAKRLAAMDLGDDESVESAPKRRMPRKDKGIKKSSTLNHLVGDNTSQASTPFPIVSYDDRTFDDIMNNYFSHYEHDNEDDWNQLSGSMTLVGDHLYHNGRGYHLVNSEDGSADQNKLAQVPPSSITDVDYVPCTTAVEDSHLQPFFDFEHETEEIRPGLIDPMLLKT